MRTVSVQQKRDNKLQTMDKKEKLEKLTAEKEYYDVEYLEKQKQNKKGRLYSFDDQKISSKGHLPGMIPAVIAESTNATLSITNLIGLLPVFALYRKYNTKVVINKDGTLSIESEDFPEVKSKDDKY